MVKPYKPPPPPADETPFCPKCQSDLCVIEEPGKGVYICYDCNAFLDANGMMLPAALFWGIVRGKYKAPKRGGMIPSPSLPAHPTPGELREVQTIDSGW